MNIKFTYLIIASFILTNIQEINSRLNIGTRNVTIRERRAVSDCGDGYSKNWWGTCIDINECDSSEEDICPGEECVNTVGSYECKSTGTEAAAETSNDVGCPEGYKRNWWGRCQDIDECQQEGICGSDTCENKPGTYNCIKKQDAPKISCQPGYFYNLVTEECEDIDECSMEMDNCMEFMCENVIGSFKCIEQLCYPGFEYTTAGCQDINECQRFGDAACSGDELCHNIKGSYVCQKCIRGDNELQCYQRRQCMPGFEPSKLTFNTCTDVDECKRDLHQCSEDEQCVNTIPGYRCECRHGLTRNLKNECKQGHHSCGIDNICFDLTHYSSCPKGFQLSNDRLKCEDIDECSQNTSACGANQECHNYRGGHRCYVKLA